MPEEKAVLAAIQRFAEAVTAKMTQLTTGEPEDQLRGPFETLVQEVGQALSLKVVSTGETRLPGRLGKPDYAVHTRSLLVGYVELTQPNLFGRAQNLHVKFEKGASKQNFELGFSEPWLFDTPTSLGADLFNVNRSLSYSDEEFTEGNRGGGLRVGRRL